MFGTPGSRAKLASRNLPGIAVGVVTLCYIMGAWVARDPNLVPINTDNSPTSGLQEAINYAQANGYGLKVVGGSVTSGGTYPSYLNIKIGVTLGSQSFSSYEFRNVILTATSAVTGPALQFNNLLWCNFDYKGGYIQYAGSGSSVVLFKPQTNDPAFSSKTLQNSFFEFPPIYINSGSGAGSVNSVVEFDTTLGRITNNFFRFAMLNGSTGSNYTAYGMQLGTPASTQAMVQNYIEFGVITGFNTTGLRIGTGAQNANSPLATNTFKGAITTSTNVTSYIDSYGFLDDMSGIMSCSIDAGSCATGIIFQTGSYDNIPPATQVSATTQVRDSGINNGRRGGTNNVLLNGSFDVWQRGTTFASITTTSTYTADRWKAIAGASALANISKQTTSMPTGFLAALQVQRPNANTNTTAHKISHTVESVNAVDMAGKNVVFSCWLKAGANFSAASSIVLVRLVTGTVADEGSSSLLAGTWTGTSDIASISQAITTSWVRYSWSGVMPAAALEIGVVLGFTPVGTAGAADYFQIAGARLEVGQIPSSFQREPISKVLLDCERYYEMSYDHGTAPGTASTLGNAEVIRWNNDSSAAFNQTKTVYYRSTKRISPTVTSYSTVTGTAAKMRDVTAAADVTATVSNNSTKAFTNLGANNASAAGMDLAFQWSADAEL